MELNRRETREVLKKYGLVLRKARGQTMLVDTRIAERIAELACDCPSGVVVEIGAGLGALTSVLAPRARFVIALEIDERFRQGLSEILAGYKNVNVVWQDALKVDFDDLVEKSLASPESYNVASNLPYSAGSRIIIRLMKTARRARKLVLMVQKEVADRMVAGPGSKRYGLLSIWVQFYGIPKIVQVVPRRAFLPVPEVQSAIVEITRRGAYPDVPDEDLYFGLVKAAFSSRRKILSNTFSGTGLGLSKGEWLDILAEAGVDPRARPEMMGVDDYARLSWAVFGRGIKLKGD